MAKTKKDFGGLPLRQQKQIVLQHSLEIARREREIEQKRQEIDQLRTRNGMAA